MGKTHKPIRRTKLIPLRLVPLAYVSNLGARAKRRNFHGFKALPFKTFKQNLDAQEKLESND
jgi:hypothetical protein